MSDILRLVTLDQRHIQQFERLMGGKEFGGCFCAVWHAYGPDWEARCKERSGENLKATVDLIANGGHAGFLVRRDDDGAFVGWTAAGPKTAFPFLKDRPGSRLGAWDDSVWSVACLAVAFAHRGRGYSLDIVKAVAAEAKRAGARALEAYPLEPSPEGSEYRGSKKLYESAGLKTAEGEPAGESHALRMELSLS